jgi:hypothetical protein
VVAGLRTWRVKTRSQVIDPCMAAGCDRSSLLEEGEKERESTNDSLQITVIGVS